MWQGLNRRRFPRANYPCRVIVYRKGRKDQLAARTENIGQGGICTLLKEELAKFAVVEVAIFLEDNLPPIECEARVVWVVKRKQDFDTGIEFLNLSQKDTQRIERIVQECLKKDQISSEPT